jgi:DNA-binding response OmpR family regulator
MVMPRILIVEDDERIGASLARAFEAGGYQCTRATTAQASRDAFNGAVITDEKFDLVLLDLGLPDGDGLDVCRWIVERDPLVPVMMLTARDDELDVVIGLDAGAIDYITKPFSLAALQARVRAQLRHRPLAMNDPTRRDDSDELVVDTRSRTATLHGEPLLLRMKEFDLLARLFEDRGGVVSRETLMSDVWDNHWTGSTKTLDFHIGALRSKIDRPGTPSRITTVRGVGFRLETMPGATE